MRVVVILLLLVLLLPVAPSAESARWQQRRVVVYDYSGPEWRPFVQEAVAYFNANLPKRAPELIYVGADGICVSRRGAISVCVVPDAQLAPQELANTAMNWRAGKMRRADIRLRESPTGNLLPVCHELFHAMGVVEHGAWVDMRPCPYDAEAMQRLYQREPRRKHR